MENYYPLTSMRKLLFLSYYFPPIHVNAIVRIKHFYEGFCDNGFQVIVQTGKFPKNIPRDGSSDMAISTICYIPLIGIRFILMAFHLTGPTLPLSWKRKSIIQRILNIRKRLPFDLIIGDGGLFYLLLGYLRGFTSIKRNQITHLFTSFSPMTDHFIAYLLKCNFPHIHWMADFRDLPEDIKNPDSLDRFLFTPIFRRMMHKVDAVVTVSEGLSAALKKFHPNIHIYSGCIVEEDMALPPKHKTTFNINYTGSIYPDTQELLPFIRVILHLIDEGSILIADIKWTYCGIHSSAYKDWLSPYFPEAQLIISPLLSHYCAGLNQREAAINVLLTWGTDQQKGILTTKLFEYLAVGKPILVWTTGNKEQEMTSIIEQCHPGGYFNTGMEERMKDWILERYIKWKNNEDDFFTGENLLKNFGIANRNQQIKKVSDTTPTQKNT
jgi:glycosyltransferase involved in cell wall biosynthesis